MLEPFLIKVKGVFPLLDCYQLQKHEVLINCFDFPNKLYQSKLEFANEVFLTVKKWFCFELKGGNDRDLNKSTFYKEYGMQQSLTEAKLVTFPTSYPNFKNLPKKVVLVHNGVVKGTIRSVYEGFIKKEFPKRGKIEYDR